MAQGHQTRRIIGADRSKVNGGPIAQDDDLVDIARESLDSNGLSRPPRNLSLDAHGARPSNRSVKVVYGLEWRRFIDMLSCRLRRQVGVVWVQPYDGSTTNVYAYKYLVAMLPANPVGQLDQPSHRQEAPTQVSRARDHGRQQRQRPPALGIFLILRYTGMRRESVATLRLRHLDPEWGLRNLGVKGDKTRAPRRAVSSVAL